MVINKHHHRRLRPNLLNGIQVSHRIHIIQPAKLPRAGARPPLSRRRVHAALLQLAPPTLPPLIQKLLLVLIHAIQSRIAPEIAVQPAAAVLLWRCVTAAAKHAPPRVAHPVLPLGAALGGLVGSGVRDHALDARGGAGVEPGRRQPDLGPRVHGGHAHGCFDLGVAEAVFFVFVLAVCLVVRVERLGVVVVVSVFWVRAVLGRGVLG